MPREGRRVGGELQSGTCCKAKSGCKARVGHGKLREAQSQWVPSWSGGKAGVSAKPGDCTRVGGRSACVVVGDDGGAKRGADNGYSLSLDSFPTHLSEPVIFT